MKKIYYLLFIMLLFCMDSFYSQGTITGLSIIPNNPTVNDTIYVYADLQFPNSSCEFFNSTENLSGNNILVTTQHCTGMLMSICDIRDTFQINPLPAGNYVFDLTLTSDINFGIVPCTGGNSPNDNDTLHFEVIDLTSIHNQSHKLEFDYYPNPNDGNLNVVYNSNINSNLIIYDSYGRIIDNLVVIKGINFFNLSLSSGIYFLEIRSYEGEKLIEKLIVH